MPMSANNKYMNPLLFVKDNNIVNCDMALQYNFPVSDCIWQFISWIWQLWKKNRTAPRQDYDSM